MRNDARGTPCTRDGAEGEHLRGRVQCRHWRVELAENTVYDGVVEPLIVHAEASEARHEAQQHHELQSNIKDIHLTDQECITSFFRYKKKDWHLCLPAAAPPPLGQAVVNTSQKL
eukprot:gene4393-biopygen14495